MAGIGEEMGTMVIGGVGKTAQLIAELLEAIIKKNFSKENSGTSKVAANKLDGRIGLVSARKMQETGLETANWGMYVTKDGMKNIAGIFRREGIVYTGVVDKYRKDDLGAKDFYVITVFKKDLERALAAVERHNAEVRFNSLDLQRREILAKDIRDITAEDVVTLRDCITEMDAIQRDNCLDMNRNMDMEMVSEAIKGISAESGQGGNRSADKGAGRTFDINRALDANTGRALDRDRNTILADARDPEKTITCHGYNAQGPDGRTYVRTDYLVSDGRGKKLTFTDGYDIEGRKRPWKDVKKDIAEAASFSGTFYKFLDRSEYERWKKDYGAKNRDGLSEMCKPHEERNYDAITRVLEDQLKNNGAEIRDGEVYAVGTGRAMKDIAETDKNIGGIIASESLVIAEQIGMCRRIEQLENAYRVAQVQSLTAPEGSKEKAEAFEKMGDVKAELNTAQDEYMKLLSAREIINGRYAMDEKQKNAEHENPFASDEKTQEILKSADKFEQKGPAQSSAREWWDELNEERGKRERVTDESVRADRAGLGYTDDRVKNGNSGRDDSSAREWWDEPDEVQIGRGRGGDEDGRAANGGRGNADDRGGNGNPGGDGNRIVSGNEGRNGAVRSDRAGR